MFFFGRTGSWGGAEVEANGGGGWATTERKMGSLAGGSRVARCLKAGITRLADILTSFLWFGAVEEAGRAGFFAWATRSGCYFLPTLESEDRCLGFDLDHVASW